MYKHNMDNIPMGALLGRNAHLSRAIIEAHLETHGMTLSQGHVLMYLHQLGGQATQSALTEHLHIKPSTANGLVDRLEERGLVSRTVDPKDGRQRIVAFTPEGTALHIQIKQGLDQGEAVLLSCFTPEERQTLRSLLIRLTQHLEQEKTLC